MPGPSGRRRTGMRSIPWCGTSAQRGLSSATCPPSGANPAGTGRSLGSPAQTPPPTNADYRSGAHGTLGGAAPAWPTEKSFQDAPRTLSPGACQADVHPTQMVSSSCRFLSIRNPIKEGKK
uniref:Uncharacterized protein n=1 Tax=Chlorocebus sabaeus TaxID=60711 RepID=A0A0D9RX82_CHLSB